MEVREFLQRMYTGRPGYAGISYQKTTRRSEDDLEGEKSGFLTRGFAASSIDTMVEAVAQLNAKHCDVWFSNATYATRPTHRKRGSARDVISIAGLWADIDCSVGDHRSKHSLPPTLDDGHALIRAPRPTIVIETGGGLHSYWLFDQPWVFNAGDPAPAQLMEAWTGMLQRRAATYAWHVDSSVMDLARVLRVPETANYKMPYPRPVKVREYNTDAPTTANTSRALSTWPGCPSHRKRSPALSPGRTRHSR